MTAPLSSWGHTTDHPPRSAGHTDPRVARTRAHVLEHARQLLEEQGPAGLHFSSLAEHARVARQTLYRYWPDPETLVGDLILQRVAQLPSFLVEPEETLTAFLVALRATLLDPATSAAYSLLIAGADRHPAAAHVLGRVLDARRAVLNDRLSGLHPPLPEEGFLGLVGPLLAAHFIARKPISDDLITRTVGSALRQL